MRHTHKCICSDNDACMFVLGFHVNQLVFMMYLNTSRSVFLSSVMFALRVWYVMEICLCKCDEAGFLIGIL